MTEIKVSELKQGVEVDMPVEWHRTPVRQCTIAWNETLQRFVLMDIKTKEIQYSYTRLSDLVRTTNQIYEYNDIAVEDE